MASDCIGKIYVACKRILVTVSVMLCSTLILKPNALTIHSALVRVSLLLNLGTHENS